MTTAWLSVVLASPAVALGQTAPPADSAPAEAWLQFRGTPALTGVSRATPPPVLKVLWSYEAGDIIESSAATVGGVVYVGVGNGDLLALDLASGALKWKYAAGHLMGESSPAVHDGMVYIGDLDGTLHAVRASDGVRQWTFETDGEIRSSPVVTDGMVLFGSYDTHLYAVDAASGRLRWKVQTDGPVHGTPAVHAGLTFIAGCDMTFRAIRVADGSQAYAVPIAAYTAASPLIVGGRAYFGTFENEVLAVDLSKRSVVWRYADPARGFPFYSSAAHLDGTIFVGGRDKFVHAIDATTGKAAWSVATRARVDSSPTIAAGRIYVGSSDGRLYVLDAATGRKLSEFDAGDAITASPTPVGTRVIVGAHNGVIYCLG